jgi:predicted metal-dependent hydrolase
VPDGSCGTPDDAAEDAAMTRRGMLRTMEGPAIAQLAGGPVPYTLRHSPRARGIRVVLHPERGVVVTVPTARTARGDRERLATVFLAEREAWLRRHLGRQAALAAELVARGGATDGGQIPFRGRLHAIRVVPAVSGVRRSDVVAFDDELVIHRVAADRRSDAAILERWLREAARVAIETAVETYADALGVTPTAVTLRDPRTRWGSASRHGRLSFSWRLVLAPPEALQTVVVHELAHMRVFGHGPKFWALVATHRPEHRLWRRWLHDHSTEIHTALDPAGDLTRVALTA